MPHPNNKAKRTGDIHPPDVADDLDARRAASQAEGDLGRALADEAKPGKGVNQAGFLKDKDGDMGKDKP